MFARKKPARSAEISTPTDAPPEPAASAETPTPTPTPTPTLAPAPASAPAVVLDEVKPPRAEPAAAPASPAHGGRSTAYAAPAARPKAASFLAADLAFTGTLSGEGDVHLGGPFEGDISVRDVTVGAGGRVEGVITGRRIEVLGQVRGGLVAEEVRVRPNAQVDGDVTSGSFSLEAGSRFEGRSRRTPR